MRSDVKLSFGHRADDLDLQEAHKRTAAKVPVCVQPQPGVGNPSFLVLFEDTEFIAGGFYERSAADIFAGNWNARL